MTEDGFLRIKNEVSAVVSKVKVLKWDEVTKATMTPEQADEHARLLIDQNDGRGWDVRRNQYGFAVAVTYDGFDILHLVEGDTRTEACVDVVVERLNLASCL